jgi:CheY-like chemotaxis protein
MTTLTTDPIVMVDDNEGDLYIAQHCYRRSKLTNPWLTFPSGPALVAYLGKVKAGEAPMPALVLLDINMPQMNGHEVLESVRSDSYFAQLPIFCMLTSSSDPRDEQRARRLGASGFMTKPANMKDYVDFFNSFMSIL